MNAGLRRTLSLLLLTFIWHAAPIHALEYHPTHLIVKFKHASAKLSRHQSTSSGLERAVPLFADSRKSLVGNQFTAPIYLFEFKDQPSRLAAENSLAADPEIEYVERDYRAELFSDPLFTKQWGLHNTGQEYYGIDRRDGIENDSLVIKSGTPGADINKPSSPNPATGHHRVLLAITDTGVDYHHPDLEANIWINEDEIPDNGLDDDLNGYIDDYYGYDFSGDETTNFEITGDPDPRDTIGHGTHVSGIAAAVTGNGIGVEGVAENVRIMCLKIFPNAFASVISRAVIYAVENGAEVINASWGTPYYSSLIDDVVEFADQSGVLFVAASGNTGDNSRFYPAGLDQCLTVGASNSFDEVTLYSTYGSWIDLVAPGRDILSLRAANTDLYAASGEPGIRIIDDIYYLADGTSMASPHVAGAAAYLLSIAPGISIDSLKDLLTSTADDYVDPYHNSRFMPGKDIYSGYGRVNLGRATGMLSGDYVEIEAPFYNTVLSGTVEIIGSAVSQTQSSYLLEARPASLDDWISIASGPADKVRANLAEWDSSPYDGGTELRLSLGEKMSYSRTVRLINSVQVELLSPQDGDTVISATDIVGSASLPGFQKWELAYYADTAPTQKNLIATSTRPSYHELLTDWKIGPIRPGSGSLRLTVTGESGSESTQIPIVISSFLTSGYPLDPGSRPGLNPVMGNIDDDPYPEIVSGAADYLIVNHFAQHQIEHLTAGFASSYYSSVALCDFENDGKDEIVAVTDSGVAVLEASGEMMPGWPKSLVTGNMYYEYPTPLVTDIDGDGTMEILVINQSGDIYCWRYDGRSYFSATSGVFARLNDSGQYRVFGGAAVPYLFAYDFDNDGFQDVGTAFVFSGGGGGLFMFSGKSGAPLYPVVGSLVKPLENFFGGLLADFDDDGIPEIALIHWFGGGEALMGVSVCESNGAILPRWPHYFRDKSQWFSAYPTAADLDGDSIPELVATLSSIDGGEVYVWHGDGSPLMETEFGPRDGLLASVPNSLGCPLIVDVDDDRVPEIVSRGGALLFGKYEKVYAIELDGTSARGWPEYTYADPAFVTFSPYTPLAGDFDLDGKLELMMNSSDRRIYSWELPTRADTAAVVWGKFLRDNRNTGLLPIVARSNPPEPEVKLPRAFTLRQNFPNPFNASTTIQLEMKEAGAMTLDIFNILGQRVTVLNDRPLVAGVYRFSWDGRNRTGDEVASGVYFYRMRVGEFKETKKMLFLK